MLPANSGSNKGRPSKRGFITLGSKGKPWLAVDTSVSQHQAQVPQQVFPYESRTQELSLLGSGGFRDVKSGKPVGQGKERLRRQLEDKLHIRPTAQRSVSDNPSRPATDGCDITRPNIHRCRTATGGSHDNITTSPSRLPSQLLHNRIKGLRPAPLDLSSGVSPSDRAITIGLEIPTAPISNYPTSPQSNVALQHRNHNLDEVQTPTIVITPAREDFAVSRSPEAAGTTLRYRPASSVYSRYTNCAPKHGNTPPVPPLPLFAKSSTSRQSAVTVFEEDAEPQVQHRRSRPLTSQSHLPTPRRSRGWWNVVTSPFSAASSKSTAHFWRSPVVEDGLDQMGMLSNASAMGEADPHAGLIFTSRALDDNELRTALPADTRSDRPSLPKRSDTAPGVLDSNVAAVNIYRIPSQGLAAAYYDSNRHFPSMIIDSGELSRGSLDLEDWSPSQSDAHVGHDHFLIHNSDDVAALADHAMNEKPKTMQQVAGTTAPLHMQARSENPFTDDGSSWSTPSETERNVFSTPSDEEMRDATPPRPILNDRSNTLATMRSVFSAMTATPVVAEACMARIIDPSAEHGELREVELTSTRGAPPPELMTPAASLKVEPTAHRRVLRNVYAEPRTMVILCSEKGLDHPGLHNRNDSSGSFGLGISDAGSEKEEFSLPKLPRKQTYLGALRSGQLTSGSSDDQISTTPWYRRWRWLLVSLATIILLLVLVFLVMIVPGRDDTDTEVEASYLALAGFPAIPTGVATIIQPNVVRQVSACVDPAALWSCKLPTAGQQDSAIVQRDQPNFRFEIQFRNGTVPKNETLLAKRTSGPTVSAGAVMRRGIRTGSLFTASPAAPSNKDQLFVGQYTDNVTAPYDGEKTPFYISLLDPVVLEEAASKLRIRKSSVYPYPTTSSSNSSGTVTSNAAESIPKPALEDNGQPAQAELYPYATAQPLRLFNRGEESEHYGFYTYFDRSLYVSNISTLVNGSDADTFTATSDIPPNNASAVCTWSQTRLLVQIWTQKQSVGSLNDSTHTSSLSAVNSTANDMTAPGSFPLAVTISLDRHGGHASKKGIYCYGLDGEHRVLENVKMWVNETRDFGGDLVNPASVPNGNSSSLTKRHGDDYGGVDGGNGGCLCQWQNWK